MKQCIFSNRLRAFFSRSGIELSAFSLAALDSWTAAEKKTQLRWLSGARSKPNGGGPPVHDFHATQRSHESSSHFGCFLDFFGTRYIRGNWAQHNEFASQSESQKTCFFNFLHNYFIFHLFKVASPFTQRIANEDKRPIELQNRLNMYGKLQNTLQNSAILNQIRILRTWSHYKK